MSADARVRRLLSSRADGPALAQSLDLVARLRLVPDAARNAGDFSGVEVAGLALIDNFIDECRPLARGLDEVVRSVGALAAAAQDAERHVAASTRAAEDFVAAAADLRGSTTALRKELQLARELAAEFEVRPRMAAALQRGPGGGATNAKGEDAFFPCLVELLALRAALEQRTRLDAAASVTDLAAGPDANAVSNSSGGSGGGANAILLEQLEACQRLEAAALDALFDWALEACRSADDPSADSSGVTPSREPLVGDLRRAVAVFAARRPLFLASCQHALVHARRGSFLRRFLSRIMAATGVGAARDAMQQLSEILAVVHGSLAEESVFLNAVFLRSGSGSGDGDSESAALTSAAARDEGEEGAPPVVVMSPLRLLADISNGVATPVAIRLSAILDEVPGVAAAICCLDTLLFYSAKLGQLLDSDASAVAAALEQATQRAAARAEQLLLLTCERIRAHPVSLPTRLVLAPLTGDVCLELQALLQASAGPLLSEPGRLVALADVPRFVQSLTEPLLGYCRASAEGMDLVSTCVWMINNAASVQSALAPFPFTSDTVQMLAGEVAAWEDSVVAHVSNDVLRETGMLAALAAQREAAATIVEAGSAVLATGNAGAGASAGAFAGATAQRAAEAVQALGLLLRRVVHPGLLAVLELISHPKVRARTRRDVGALLCAAFSRLRAALLDEGPAGLAGQAGVAAALESLPVELEAVLGA